MSTEVIVEVLPLCDFCDKWARYDARTKDGPWAYLCGVHWRVHSVGVLGTGNGQRLIVKKDNSDSQS